MLAFVPQIQAKYYNNEIPEVCIFFKPGVVIVSNHLSTFQVNVLRPLKRKDQIIENVTTQMEFFKQIPRAGPKLAGKCASSN